MKYRVMVVLAGFVLAMAPRPAPASPNVCAALNGEVVTVEGITIQRSFDSAHGKYSFILNQPTMCGAQIGQITVYGKGRPPCDEGRRARVTGRFGYVNDAARALTGNLLFADVVRCY
ncbi:MAG: hypothetical protein WCF13_08490 [Stellaceae bacterium]